MGHAGKQLGELWRYRELCWTLCQRDIKVRYKQTVLGVVWAVLQPIVMMLIFSFIFGRLAKIPSDGFPYPVFVFSGLLAWNFFSSAVSAGGSSMVGAANLISKVYFPRLVIPISSIGVSCVDFVISLLLLIIIMFFYSVPFSSQLILFPVFTLGMALTALGISAWLSAVTVVYRDFRFVVPFAIQIGMYLTPVIYPLTFIPEQFRWLIYLNPIAGWVTGIRASILGTPIDWVAVSVSAIFSIAILVLGVRYFGRAERRFADVI